MPFKTVSTPDLETKASALDALLERMPDVGDVAYVEAAVLAIVAEQLRVAAELERRAATAGEPFDPYCEF
jgi:hypothetical protein